MWSRDCSIPNIRPGGASEGPALPRQYRVIPDSGPPTLTNILQMSSFTSKSIVTILSARTVADGKIRIFSSGLTDDGVTISESVHMKSEGRDFITYLKVLFFAAKDIQHNSFTKTPMKAGEHVEHVDIEGGLGTNPDGSTTPVMLEKCRD